MEQIIDGLLNDFERGKMPRRQLVQSLTIAAAAAVATPALAAQPKGLKITGVNHISYGVADYARTRDFYADLLGMRVSHDDGKQCYLSFGDSFLIPRKTKQPDNKPYIDHVAYTLETWDPAAVEAELKRRNLEPKADQDSFLIKDPDGFTVQLSKPYKP